MNTKEDTTTDLSENKAKKKNTMNNTILIYLKNLSKMNNFLAQNLSKQI